MKILTITPPSSGGRMTTMTEQQTIRQMIKRQALAKQLGLTVEQLRHHERNDRSFPKSVPLTESGRAVAYFVSDIARWQEAIAERRKKVAS